MRSANLTPASEAIQALVGVAPPVLPLRMRGGTRITGRWANPAYEGYVPPMSQHVLAATFAGTGVAHARIDGKRTTAPAHKGAITLAPMGHDGDWTITQPILVSNVYLSNEHLLDCAEQIAEGKSFELIDRVHTTDHHLFAILAMISNEVEKPTYHSSLFMDRLTDLLCFQLIRNHSTLGDVIKGPQRGLAAWQIRKVTAYMRANIATDLTLKDLADTVGLSRYHFCTAFRVATGSSPHEHLVRMRMKVAAELLASSDDSIASIGAAVGYRTPSAFSSVFSRVIGVTPSMFRRKL